MTVADLPLLEVAGAFPEALRDDALGGLPSATLERWLRSRRWFGGKGRAARHVGLHDAIPLHREDPPSAVARFVIDTGESRSATYQVPLAVRGTVPEGGSDPLARVRCRDGDGVLFDALEDPAFQARLGRAFAGGASFSGAHARWVVSAVDDVGRRGVPADAAPRLGRAEQSNTSILFGEAAILKIFRRIEPGRNPDAEIGRFLATRTSFRNVPRLFGTIRFEDADGTTTDAGQLQAFAAGSRDAWGYALDRLRGEIDGAAADAFATDAHRLGALTRGLHEALASDPADPAFAPEPVTESRLEGWRTLVNAQALRTFELLAASPAGRERGADLLARRDELPGLVDALVARAAPDPGARIRHHGDYHLGQVLRTADGDFLIIDFEGEPARPLAERRERHSPLRDVAGMLRSFDYAAGAVSKERPGAAVEAAAWRERARSAFLRGYGGPGPSAILPRGDGAFRALLSLFEVEKALYEVAYELDNRPDWLSIPLGGLRDVLERAHGE